MAYVICPILNGVPVIDADGAPVAGGKIWTFESGGSTPATTWADSAGTIPNTNPIVLDARGYSPVPIWLDSDTPYRILVTDADDMNPLPVFDDLTGIDPSAITVFPAAANLSMGGFRINDLAVAAAGTDALSRDAGDARYLRNPATAALSMGGFKIGSVGNATGDNDALNRITADGRYLTPAGNGSGLTNLGTPQITWNVVELTASTAIDYTYTGAFIVVNSGSSVTLTLADANAAGFFCKVLRRGTGTVTIARQTAGLINGASTSKTISAQWNVAHIYNYAAGAASFTQSAP